MNFSIAHTPGSPSQWRFRVSSCDGFNEPFQVTYPVQQGFELVDKAASRSLYVQGSVARDLRQAIDAIPDNERDEESIDALLDTYCAGAARPIVLH